MFQSKLPNDEADQANFSPANFLDFREKNLAFTDLAAYCGFHYNLITRAEPEQVEGAAVSASFFDILGVHPALGRNFLQNEDSYSSPRVVILSDRLWSDEFHRDPTILGKSIVLNGDSSMWSASCLGDIVHWTMTKHPCGFRCSNRFVRIGCFGAINNSWESWPGCVHILRWIRRAPT